MMTTIFSPYCMFFSLRTSEVKAVKMTSSRTQLPYDYYSLQFCRSKNGALHYKSENLGEVLRGNQQNLLLDVQISHNNSFFQAIELLIHLMKFV